MNTCTKYSIRNLAVFSFLLCIMSCNTESNSTFPETTKVSLREVGHHLLLASQDTTSLVKPILAIEENKYQLSFENTLIIHPDSLVTFIRTSFKKADLPQFYLVEVLQCDDNEVAYSYEMKQNVEKGIVPCGGRQLKNGCYLVTVRFTQMPEVADRNSNQLYLIGLGVLAILGFIIYKRRPKNNSRSVEGQFESIGRYKFYPEQNKLIKEAIEISLSKKECELLALFVAQPNQIIKRDVLTKKVWEDNGVVVGRSLDTYISKLRKKLQDDESIKLTNVHGVGYKLELS